MLITYLVRSLESVGDAIRAADDGSELKVTNLVASKHTKHSFPVESTGRGVVSFNSDSSAQWRLFPLPAAGKRLEYHGELPLELNLEPSGQYEVEHLTLGQAEFSVRGAPSAAPFAARISWANGTATHETWHAEQTFNELVSDAEVGVLSIDETESELGDVVASGRARRVPEDKQSSPIMFHQVNAWRPYGNTSTSLTQGMHPKLAFEVDAEAPAAKCMLYLRLDMPPCLFVDQFELENLPDMHPPSELVGVWGSTDLEAPVWMVNEGSTALMRLSGSESNHLRYEIPLHLRYEVPGHTAPRVLPAPQLFWACEDSNKQQPLGFDEFFPVGTSFYSIATNDVELKIPSADPASQARVETATAATVLACTLWIIYRLFKRD